MMKYRRLRNIGYGVVSFLLVISSVIFLLEYFSNYKTSKTIHPDAPVITRKSIIIKAPAEKVWKVFSDVDHWDAWQKEIVTPKINGAFKPGTSFTWKSNGLTITSTLQTVEINKMAGWSGPAFGAFGIHTWYFTEHNGQTTIRVEESMEGWLVNLLKHQFQSSLDTSIDYWLNSLKIEAEK
ncbi:SRPBCC family protein [Chryseobacterium sp. Leaf404]|uniref:SRPBCC family protein n=2 Tax=unclassified Chryseobacterium TaxID=2593645 RepID=UPI0012FF373A|nr:SRPBCC family protein [Chryseobacterium sp. Leaf404]